MASRALIAEASPLNGQQGADRLSPSGRGNNIGHYPHHVGRDRSPCQTGQHPERQQHFDIGRESRRKDGYGKHQQPGKGHRAAA